MNTCIRKENDNSGNIEIKQGTGTANAVFRAAYDIRIAVFVKEQGIELKYELDVVDKIATHLVLYFGETPVACARVSQNKSIFKICRVAVLKEYRHKGYAT